MCQIETAATGEQELPANRRHPLVDRHVSATAGKNFGSDQPGGTTANDGNLMMFSLRHGVTRV